MRGGCQGGGDLQPAPAGARKAGRVTGTGAADLPASDTVRALPHSAWQFISKYCNCPVVNWLLNCQERHLGTVRPIIQIEKINQIEKKRKSLKVIRSEIAQHGQYADGDESRPYGENSA